MRNTPLRKIVVSLRTSASLISTRRGFGPKYMFLCRTKSRAWLDATEGSIVIVLLCHLGSVVRINANGV